MDPASIVEDTEWTRFGLQMDGQTVERTDRWTSRQTEAMTIPLQPEGPRGKNEMILTSILGVTAYTVDRWMTVPKHNMSSLKMAVQN